ncbi:MAG: peptide-N-glycosidase F-related protein [Myxococcota bacterium]
MRTLEPSALGLSILALLLGACPASPPPNASTDGSSGDDPSSDGRPATDDTTTTTTNGTVDTSGAADGTESTGAPVIPEPGDDTTVVAFEQAHVFFSGWEDGQNLRSIDVDLEFPDPARAYTSATLRLDLSCPDGACDWWDRKGSLGIVENAGTDDERVVEIARFVTPYRVGGQWSLDVSPLRPLLAGPRTVRVTIDTWVGPGHANGNGWLVDAAFDFVGGVPSERPVEVIPLWPLGELTIGDPDLPLDDQVVPAEVTIPPSASRVALWSVITGHGQGNSNNCAEFCPLAHGYEVGGMPWQRTVWREDCAENPVDNQQGTWTLSRAGWCPGDVVTPWVEDVSAAALGTESLTVRYDIQGYENTCRPEAPVCMGCVLGTGCEYDGGNHTPPVIQMSAALVVYEQTGA